MFERNLFWKTVAYDMTCKISKVSLSQILLHRQYLGREMAYPSSDLVDAMTAILCQAQLPALVLG